MSREQTFNFDPHGPGATLLQQAVESKLIEYLGEDVALDALAQFIVQLVSRGTDVTKVAGNIVEFLEEQSIEFAEWLFRHLDEHEHAYFSAELAAPANGRSSEPLAVSHVESERPLGPQPDQQPPPQRSNSVKSTVGRPDTSIGQPDDGMKDAGGKRRREPIIYQAPKTADPEPSQPAQMAGKTERASRSDRQRDGEGKGARSPIRWGRDQERREQRRDDDSRKASRSRSRSPLAAARAEPAAVRAAERPARPASSFALFRHAVGHAVREMPAAGGRGAEHATAASLPAASTNADEEPRADRGQRQQGQAAPHRAHVGGEDGDRPREDGDRIGRGALAAGGASAEKRRSEEDGGNAAGAKRSVFARLHMNTGETAAEVPEARTEKRPRASVFDRLSVAAQAEPPAAAAAHRTQEMPSAAGTSGMNGSHQQQQQSAPARQGKRALGQNGQNGLESRAPASSAVAEAGERKLGDRDVVQERAGGNGVLSSTSPAKRVRVLPGDSLAITIVSSPSSQPPPTLPARPAATERVAPRAVPTPIHTPIPAPSTSAVLPAATADTVAAPAPAAPRALSGAAARQLEAQRKELARQLAAKERELGKLSAAYAYNPQTEVDQRTVVVMNVHTATEEVLLAHFQVCGKVKRVNISRNAATGTPTGHATVEFCNRLSVAKALTLAGSSVLGRPIRVIEKAGTAAAAAPSHPHMPTWTATKAASAALAPPTGIALSTAIQQTTATGGRTYTWKRGPAAAKPVPLVEADAGIRASLVDDQDV